MVVAALRSWHTEQSSERLRAGTAWHRSDYVFTTESGRLLDQRNAARSYQRALAAAGVEIPPRFHLLRHTAASLMLADGAVSVRTASEVLGHATTSITADTYGHVAQQAKVAALDVIAGALEPAELPSKLPSRQQRRPSPDDWDWASDLLLWLPRLDSNQQPSG